MASKALRSKSKKKDNPEDFIPGTKVRRFVSGAAPAAKSASHFAVGVTVPAKKKEPRQKKEKPAKVKAAKPAAKKPAAPVEPAADKVAGEKGRPSFAPGMAKVMWATRLRPVTIDWIKKLAAHLTTSHREQTPGAVAISQADVVESAVQKLMAKHLPKVLEEDLKAAAEPGK